MSRISGISSPLRPAPGIVVDPSPGLMTPVAPVRRRRQPPSAEPTLPELARRLSSAPSMPPRAPLHVVRHSLLPPQFQSPQRPGTEPPETYQRHSKLPPQYQSPLRQSFLPPQAYQSHSAMNTFQSPYAPAPQGAFGSSVLPPAPVPQDPARPEAAAQRPPRVSVLPQVRPSILQGASPRPQAPRPSVLPQRPSFQSSGSSAASGAASAQAPMETRYSVLPARLQAASAAFQSVAHAAVAIGLESANTVQITTAAQAQEVLARVQRLATQAAPALHALSGALQHMVENKTRLSQEIREELADIGQSLLTTGQSLQKFLNHTLGRFAPQTMPPAEPPAETPADAAAAAETAAVAETTAKAEAEAAAAPPPPPPPPPKAHLKPRPPKHPAAKPALHPVSATPAPAAKPVPVDVMAISTEEGRAALRAGFGTPESADAGLREIALAFKAAQNGSTDDKRAFQLAYQDRLTLPDDFSSGNVAAVKQLKRLLAGVNVAYVSPQYGKDMGVGSDDFNARRSAAAAA